MSPDTTKSWESLVRGALCVLAALYAINFLMLGWRIGPFDYNHLSTYYDLAWRFWRAQGGLPEYNPYLCGGRTLGGDPQVPIFHPLALLVPIVGAAWLLRLEMLGQLGLGVWGLWRMLDRFGVTGAGKRWAVLLYAGGGAVVARFLVGHVTLGFYFLFPLFLALSYRLSETRGVRRQRIFAAYAGLFVYCSLYKPNFLIYGVPPLLIEVTVRAVVARRPRLLLEFIAGAAIGALVGAVSLLPAARFFHDFPRPDDGPPTWIPPWTLVANALLPLKAIPAALYGTRFLQRHEYNIFLGPVALYFTARGLRPRDPHAAPHAAGLSALAIASALLGCGRAGGGFVWWVPYSWFETFWPGFDSIRVSVRFWYGVSLALIVWSAVGFEIPRTRRARLVVLVLGVLPLLGQAAVNLSKTTLQATLSQWVTPRLYPPEIELRHTDPDTPYADVHAGRGAIECPPNLAIYPSPDLREGNTLALLPSTPAQASARWLAWNRIALEGHAIQPGALHIVFNLNHADYWTFEGHGAVVSTHYQRLAVGAPDGVISGELVFRQPLVAESLRLSGLSLALFAAFGVFAFLPGRRRTLRIGLTGGIAAGKSASATILREQGIPVIDLDRVGREITDRYPELLEKIKRLFGPEIAPGGTLDRRRMREIVFNDPRKRRALERILHPPIRREFERECAAEEKKGAPLLVCEAALLVEGGYHRHLDGLIVVTAPRELRRERLQARDNLTAELAEQIFRAQKPDEEKLRHATYVVENTGSHQELAERIRTVISELKKKTA